MTKKTIIAMGYAQGELLPPYRNEREEKEAKKILRYIEGHPKIVRASIAMDIWNYEKHFGKDNFPREIEIVGNWLEMCVSETIDFCLEIGAEVSANPEYVISFHGKNKRGKEAFLRKTIMWPDFYERTIEKTPNGLIFRQNKVLTKRNMLASA